MPGIIATDKMKSEEFFGTTNSVFNEAIRLDLKYGNTYRYWAMSLYVEGNYKMAWDIVRKSRDLGGDVHSSDFIDALSIKMPEPK